MLLCLSSCSSVLTFCGPRMRWRPSTMAVRLKAMVAILVKSRQVPASMKDRKGPFEDLIRGMTNVAIDRRVHASVYVGVGGIRSKGLSRLFHVRNGSLEI